MQSFSTSNASSHSLKYLYLHILYLLLNITIAKGFNPLIRLPTNELYTNISRTVVLCIDDFGAKGDGFTDDTKRQSTKKEILVSVNVTGTYDAFITFSQTYSDSEQHPWLVYARGKRRSLQNVWEVACSSSLRAKIVIPAGKTYLVRPTDFAGPCLSKVTLRVSGFIVAPKDPAVWEGLDVHKWLYFHGVKHLTVEGGGIIDGSGQEWWKRSCKTNYSNPCTRAPTALNFHRCRNLKVKNITFFNSQQMHLAFTHCTRVAASRINIIAPADSPNTDGIHISASTLVELKDIAIRTGDDCISIVNNSSRIYIKKIFCGAGRGISIGSLGKNNSYAWVEDVVVNGAVLFETENGVRIKTWQGGRGFARNITFENIWMHNVSNPIIINQYYCDSPVICPNQTSGVKIESVSFRGVRGTCATEDAIILACSDSYPCKRLHLEDIQLTSLSGTEKSYCWEAYGRSLGLVYPTSCISSGDIIIRYPVKSNSTSSLPYKYALI